jgi:hypothetical protein
MTQAALALLDEGTALDGMTMREKIAAITAEIYKLPFSGRTHPGAELERLEVPPVKHHFSPGIYAREMLIPKGMLLVGKIHKYPQLNIMSRGDLSVLTDNGIERLQVTDRPITVVSPGGTQRIAFAHEDTVWTTVLATEETDIAKLEEHFVIDNDAAYTASLEDQRDSKCLSV